MQGAEQTKSRAISAIWPSLLILAVTGALVGGLLGVGYLSISRMATQDSILPTHRAPWFEESVIYYDMDYANETEDQNQVLFTGGSASVAGLVTRDFEDATGKRAYNFGSIISIGPEGHYEFIRAYNRTHEPPETIIYIATARDVGFDYSFGINLLDRFRRIYAPSVPEQTASLVSTLQQYLVEGKLAIERLARPFGEDHLDERKGRRLSHNELGPSLAAGRGFQEYPQYTRIDLSYLDGMDEFPMSDWYDRGFRDIAKEAEKLGIPFYIYFTPIPENDLDVDDTPLMAWAEQFEADFPNIEVYGLPLIQYDIDLWGNGYHLNGEGAKLFTKDVANAFNGTTAKAEGR